MKSSSKKSIERGQGLAVPASDSARTTRRAHRGDQVVTQLVAVTMFISENIRYCRRLRGDDVDENVAASVRNFCKEPGP